MTRSFSIHVADARPLVLVTLCGGGWHREAQRVLEQFPADQFRFAYVYGHCRGVHGAARLEMPHDGPRYPMHYLGPTRSPWFGRFSNTARFAWSMLEADRLVKRLRPAAIIAIGTAMAVPLFVAGRRHGATCVFVESLTRFRNLSATGRWVRRLRLADRLYVQWPQLQRSLPDTTYAGAVL